MKRATNLLKENQKTFERVRDALVERKELFQADFLKVVAGENLPQERAYFWPNPKQMGGETKLSLPPKSAQRILFIKGADVSSLPFTIEEVAKAIRVNSASIRSISKSDSGGYDITFKPSFENYEHMYDICKELKKNDVECDYYSHKNALHIHRLGAEDFLKFVTEKGR